MKYSAADKALKISETRASEKLCSAEASASKYLRARKPHSESGDSAATRQSEALSFRVGRIHRNLPVTFFQFDLERFQKEHYGLAAPYEDFGNVSRTPEQAVTSLISSLNDSGKMRGVTAQIFFHQDDHNCERTFEEVLRKVQKT